MEARAIAMLEINPDENIDVILIDEPMVGGTTDYNKLKNRPLINGVTLEGDKTLEDLGLEMPDIPTKVSELTNDSNYQTGAQVTAAVAAGTQSLLKRAIFAELPDPADGNERTIYMVPESDTTGNHYGEWMLIDGAWERIGSTEVDLTDYLKKSDLPSYTQSEIEDIIEAVFGDGEVTDDGKQRTLDKSELASLLESVKENITGEGLLKKTTYTANITSDWTGSEAPYTQEVEVEGIRDDDVPYITPLLSADPETALAEKSAWEAISKAVADTGKIILTCLETAPEQPLSVIIEVFR
jgi:hypothetical protein